MAGERTRDRSRTASATDRASNRRTPPDDRPALRATVVEYDAGPDKCTLAPVDPDESRVTTAWLTANRDVFVGLADWR